MNTPEDFPAPPARWSTQDIEGGKVETIYLFQIALELRQLNETLSDAPNGDMSVADVMGGGSTEDTAPTPETDTEPSRDEKVERLVDKWVSDRNLDAMDYTVIVGAPMGTQVKVESEYTDDEELRNLWQRAFQESSVWSWNGDEYFNYCDIADLVMELPGPEEVGA